nr:hypothetical protein [Moorella sp. Hama-1]
MYQAITVTGHTLDFDHKLPRDHAVFSQQGDYTFIILGPAKPLLGGNMSANVQKGLQGATQVVFGNREVIIIGDKRILRTFHLKIGTR